MSEERGSYQKMAYNFILGNFDYEDPNNLFPMKNDTRKLMRTCRQCWVSYDINASSGACCFHRSFFRVTVPEARLGLVIGKKGSHLKEIRTERSQKCPTSQYQRTREVIPLGKSTSRAKGTRCSKLWP